MQWGVGLVGHGDVGLGPHLDVGAQRLEADEVGPHVRLARLRVVPLREEHPQSLRRTAALAAADHREMGVQRRARADAARLGAVVVDAADGRQAHGLAGHGHEPEDEVPVAEAGPLLVESADDVEQGAAMGEGVEVDAVLAGERGGAEPVVAHRGHGVGPDDELGGDRPSGVGTAAEGVNHPGEVGRVPLVVDVEVRDDLPDGGGEGEVAGGADTDVIRAQERDPGRRPPPGDVGLGDAGSTVVDQQQLPPVVGLGRDLGDRAIHEVGPGVHGADDAHERPVGDGWGVERRELLAGHGQRAPDGAEVALQVGALEAVDAGDVARDPVETVLDRRQATHPSLDRGGDRRHRRRQLLLARVDVDDPVVDAIETLDQGVMRCPPPAATEPGQPPAQPRHPSSSRPPLRWTER